jgi:DNA invertase Pin-like site-specific DNA recombinase
MIYGYARVSTEAQDLTSQLAQLKGAGCEKVFREKLTDTNTDRPQLRRPMAVLAHVALAHVALAHVEVVIIPAVDLLSRDTTVLLVIAREMHKAGAGIRAPAEPFLGTASGSCLRSLALPRGSNADASSNEQHGAAPTPRQRA